MTFSSVLLKVDHLKLCRSYLTLSKTAIFGCMYTNQSCSFYQKTMILQYLIYRYCHSYCLGGYEAGMCVGCCPMTLYIGIPEQALVWCPYYLIGDKRVTLNFLTCTSDNVWKEALSDAAKTGKRDIVRYLLNSEYISENLHTEVWLFIQANHAFSDKIVDLGCF